jgi:hypothetical protein
MQLNGYIIGIDLVPRPLGDPTEKRKQKMPVGKRKCCSMYPVTEGSAVSLSMISFFPTHILCGQNGAGIGGSVDFEKEIHSLAAEALALNIVLCNVLNKLLRDDPALRSAMVDAFNQSADTAESVAILLGKSASPDHTVKALRIIEEMRGVVLGDGKDKLKGLPLPPVT